MSPETIIRKSGAVSGLLWYVFVNVWIRLTP